MIDALCLKVDFPSIYEVNYYYIAVPAGPRARACTHLGFHVFPHGLNGGREEEIGPNYVGKKKQGWPKPLFEERQILNSYQATQLQ